MISLDRGSRNAIWEFVRTLFGILPDRLGIDEIIPGCEVINLDSFGTGILPRYVTVSINQYHQMVWYNGVIDIEIGDYVTVLHMRTGNRYEILGPSGATSTFVLGGGSYSSILVDCTTGEVVIDCTSGEVVTV